MPQAQTPEDPHGNRLDSDLPDFSEFTTNTYIGNTGEAVRRAVGSEMIGAESYAEAKREVSSPKLPEVAEVAETNADADDEIEKPKEEPTEPTEVEADAAAAQPKKRRSLKEIYQSDKFAGRIAAGAGAAAAVPPFLYLSGIGSLPLGIAGLSAAALAAPIITYNLAEKHEHKSMAGIAGLGISGGIMAAQGVTLSTVGTIASAVALPATTAYAGYKIGKSKKHPIVGGFIGAGAGMVAAQGIAGIVSGGGWAAAGGIATGSIVPLAAAGAAWVGFKGAKRSSSWAWNKWKNRKNKSEKQA